MASLGRVLVLDENAVVPFDRRVWLECTALAEAGYEVTAICPQGQGELGKPAVMSGGVTILRHPLPAETTSVLSYLREYSLALWHEWRLGRGASRYAPFDVVHICNPPDVLFCVAEWFKVFQGAAIVFDQHDICPELFATKFGVRSHRTSPFVLGLRAAERMTYAAADVVIATNETYRSIAMGRGQKQADDVFVVRSAPDLTKFTPVPGNDRYKRGRRFAVGYVGVIGEQEGIDILLEAVRTIVKRLGREDIHFMIIGGGPAVDGLRSLCERMALNGNVEFCGRVPDEELVERLSSCDVCVNPDPKTPFNDASTMTKILDYMALGKPIVQFDVREGRRSAGESSLYAVPNRPDDLAAKILRLIDDEEACARMGAIGRERMEASLQWRLQIPSLLRAYGRAMNAARMRKSRVPMYRAWQG